MTRTFVLGLDGANWDLIEPWLSAGELPNLADLLDEGVRATHRSCLPPVTFPNWKCYSAGKNPGGFGVYWFEQIDLAEEEVEIMNGRNFDTAELWDYLNETGQTTGIVNMPTMYPPRDINGPVVCGGPDAVDGEYRSIESGYTAPAELEAELEGQYDYRVHPDPLLSSDSERGAEVDEIHELLERRLQVATDLFKERDLDFVHVTLFYLNVLQHFFWNEDPTREAYQIIDGWIGRVQEFEETNLFVMSDHGCAPTTTEFYINEWLDDNDYLSKQTVVDDYIRSLGVTRERALSFAKRFHLVDTLERTVPERLQRLVPMEAGTKRERKLEKVDVDASKAVASGQGPVYINPDQDVETVRANLIADLSSVTDRNGDQLFHDVHRAEEVYTGPYANTGPQIIVEMRPGVHVNDGLGGGAIQTKPDRWAAENVREGIFAAAGPDIASAGKLDDISITDIAPTILASQGVDIPTDMVGEVVPVFNHAPTIGTQEPLDSGRDGTDGTNKAVADRLKRLGYME